ncbi:MAG: hypothetical protein ACYSTI_14455 [Planctomycetota bacterium]|jgi:hypothetical protein
MANSDDLDSTEELSTDTESSVIQKLRKADAENKAELKELRAFREEAEAAAELAVATAVEGFVNTLGFPGLKDDVIGWVEGVPTLEDVTEALQTRGLLPKEDATPPVVPPDTQESVTPSTSKLGQSVADAALGDPVKGVDERLAAAENIGEIQAIMAELDAVRDYA